MCSSCFDGFKKLLGDSGGESSPPLKLPVNPGKVPVFVMLQLDWISDDGQSLRYKDQLKSQLEKAKMAGIKGVMADVWWGVCEPQPGVYKFGATVELCQLLKSLGLQLQAVMSFHQCGGNVGDSVSFPLPAWCLSKAKESGLLYTSKSGVVSEDCLSLSADRRAIFPTAAGGLRTALQCYQDYIVAFVKAVGSHMGTTICELQVGMGPCGELRYPSYLMAHGWNWPGVGIVMAYDPGMLSMLKAETGMSEPPVGLPEDQNAMPDAIAIFKAAAEDSDTNTTGFRSGNGKVFLEWYSKVLLRHGQEVLDQAVLALKACSGSYPATALCFSVKVSGLHWHVMHPSRATEACAGYNCCTSDAADAYLAIAKMLSQAKRAAGRPVLFNFTCMEMTNNSNGGVPHSLSAPEDLIAQVRRACVATNVALAGENALEFDLATGSWAFDQIEKQIRSFSPGHDAMHGITLLRLGDAFVRPQSLLELAKFVTKI
mmetsp:Transcript_62908/g.111737  ORF Transcript_62908/g.111737 Transcript_62908/m.111737 type:complete len:485 (-) Transcript_62908:128-1582(-)|eukprot:CAMPEP_0197629472 /NCGR_PEP_ID=MMETSP1338-20131121/7304_1 /TAXON_ID=43686 ORGANISM="Pelagodinium beii, Strain RCC1491" /NCGR_SAMPLE_ID=MMETSP1338 /ASSEMBLY_ACC=CAM_ASM_000754 /LENGTH=484 /DNA_ID=CAMNT_0043200513 /DNA_START=89 /DNA_END=1543 /DNA_ORIENTATION=-